MTMKRLLIFVALLAVSAIHVSAQIIFQVSSGSAQAQVATPSYDHDTATYNNDVSVTITSATGGATICYTTDGSTPTATTPGTCSHGSTYSTAVSVGATGTVLKSIATKSGLLNSSEKDGTYTLTAATPTFSPTSPYSGSSTTVTASSTTTGGTMYLDQSNPPTTAQSSVTASSSGTWYAQAKKSSYNNSSVASWVGTISGPTAWGVAFRDTSGYVSDGAGDTYALCDAYPTTRGGLTFGWVIGGGSCNPRDRSTGAPVRLAGVNWLNALGATTCASHGSTPYFRFDLPNGAGTYTLRLAAGDYSNPSQETFFVCDGSTTLATYSAVATTTGNFMDASGAIVSAANWNSSNTSISITTSGSQIQLVPSLTSPNQISIAYVQLSQ
jgi:hypothetical protein